MGKMEKVITAIQEMENGTERSTFHPVVFLLLTLVYLSVMLSVPVDSLSMLLWYGLYPIVMASVTGQDFNKIFVRSLVVVPFAMFIGIFNPVYQTELAFKVGDVEVSRGWVTFVSIIIRALLSVQALLLLAAQGGFVSICQSLRRIGVPSVLTTQLMMVYRYMTVLLQESIDMSRGRKARGYGKRNPGLKVWGTLCGQLFLRTVNRSQNIHRAMLARGFTGTMPCYRMKTQKLRIKDVAVSVVWVALFLAMRFFNFSRVFDLLI